MLARALGPADLGGVTTVYHPYVSGDGKAWVYACTRTVSRLYVVEGAR